MKSLLELSDEAAQELRLAIDDHKGLLTPEAYDALSSSLGSSVAALRDSVRALRALYTVRASADVSIEEFAEDIRTAVSDFMSIELSRFGKAEMIERLKSLLSIESMIKSSKRASVRSNNERSFCKAAFTTDIRPVVTGGPSSEPDAAMLVHNLKLGFHDSKGIHRDIFISFEPRDLARLKKAVTDAENFAKQLNPYLKLFSREDAEVS